MSLWTTGWLPVGWPGWSSFSAAATYRYDDPAAPDHVGEVRVRVGASPRRGSRSTTFAITWASSAAEAGFAYDVQIRRPGRSWRVWKDAASKPSGHFTADAGRGTYRFRARLVELHVGHAAWSPVTSIRVG
jgi:hypothetical protein